MISIVTSCIGRELYLKRLIDSMRITGYNKIDFEHFIVFQEQPPSDKIRNYIKEQPFGDKIKIGITNKIEPVGAIIQNVLNRAKYPILFKIDDDCSLLSIDFLFKAYELCTKMPKAIIYPAIVDGEIPPQGGRISCRQSVFLEKNNIFLTVGEATLPSGKYLIPIDLAKKIPFKDQNDAELVMIFSLQSHLPIFQALNGLVIEIQEGYSGQQHRIENPDGQKW